MTEFCHKVELGREEGREEVEEEKAEEGVEWPGDESGSTFVFPAPR